jgi:hypothetical protein
MSKQDRLERLRKLESLRRIAADIARGDTRGLAEVKEEGRQIVAEREARLEREPVGRDAGQPDAAALSTQVDKGEESKPKKKRGGGNDDVV